MCVHVLVLLKVLFLTDVEREPTLTEALKSNIVSAACCATLLMEDNVHFTPVEFFNQVAGLSYKGTYIIHDAIGVVMAQSAD